MNAASARVLIDANVFLRQAQPADALHQIADSALRQLAKNGATLCIIPQTLYEFWAVATRPATSRGGLGWTPAQTEIEVVKLEKIYTFLPDTPNLFTQWRRLVTTYNVSGMSSHDARLVASMKTHGLEEILTFNTKDFVRYSPEPIRVLDPPQVTANT